MPVHPRPPFRTLRPFIGVTLYLLVAGLASGAQDNPLEDKTLTLIAHLERGRSEHLCFDATVEGVAGTIMVDTGSPSTLLNESKYGFLLHGPNRTLPSGVPVTTRVNTMVTPVAFARDFHVGSNNLGGAAVALVPQHFLYGDLTADHWGRGSHYDGIMGENFLRRYRAVLDCGRRLLYATLGASKSPALASVLPARGWTRVPMSDAVRSFSVPCTVNGRRFRLIVDTGAPYTVLDQTLLARAQVKCTALPLKGALIGNREDPLGLADMDHLQIGGYTATHARVESSPTLGRACAYFHDDADAGPVIGLLGSDMLALNGAIIDVGGHALYLKHPPGDERKP